MSIETTIKDGKGSASRACVTKRNQLVTAPLDFSTFYPVTADVIDTGYNIAPAMAKLQFIITDIVLSANRNVGVNDATVVIYEADSLTETTVAKTVFTQEMVKQTSIAITGLNIIVTEGKWLNVKTNDDDVFVNVAGYYVDAVD